MRHDFNKLLTEHERVNSSMCFRSVRHSHRLDDEVAHRESMKSRYTERQKEFGENLRPILGYLQSRVGRNWDKVYSDIRKNFDTRKVINAHIMQHLYDYVAIKVELDERRKPIVRTSWEVLPVGLSYYKFFVDPRDGILKPTHSERNKSRVNRQRRELTQKNLSDIKRVISKDLELHRLAGIWYAVTIGDGDAVVDPLRLRLNWAPDPYSIIPRSEDAKPELYGWLRFKLPINRVYISKQALSSKQLKQYKLQNAAV